MRLGNSIFRIQVTANFRTDINTLVVSGSHRKIASGYLTARTKGIRSSASLHREA